jgi:DNA helicase-2/ATP-dependent DNA helicase PcrA
MSPQQPKPPQPQVAQPAMQKAAVAPAVQRPQATSKKKPFGSGSTIRHPKYGRGTVLRREGDGDDAKLTVSFPGYGLKKLVEKYAGIKEE